MNKKFFRSKSFYRIMTLLIVSVFVASCKKYDSLGFTPGNGTPTISSVHTWSKTDTTVYYDTIISYDASGNVSQTLQARSNKVNAFDSVTTAGSLGNYYIIYGTNLGSATSVSFNGYTAYFNRALLTDNSIVVQIPSKTPYLAPLATDSLIVTTLNGRAYYKFSILSPPPTVSGYSNYNFSAGSQIEITGVGFASVMSVVLTDASAATADVSIVSQNDSSLVLQFPSTLITSGNLTFSYDAGGNTKTATADQELVDLDNAYQIFTDDYQNSWANNSWSGQADRSTDVFKTGSASFKGVYPSNGWKIEGFANWWPSLPYDGSYKYLSFWVKGGTVAHTLNIETNTSSAGYGQNDANPVIIPPGVWTYFKIPLSSLDFWSAGSTLQQLGFFLRGQGSDVDEAYYFDDVILVK